MNRLIINKKDLEQNINEIKKQVNVEAYTIIGVVKGNGYGLGMEEYSKVLIENGITMLAVATVQEALTLREKFKDIDILNMSSTAIKEEAEELVKNNIIVTIGSEEDAKILNEIANEKVQIRAHIKIDTGFGRYGFLYNDKENIVKTIKNLNENILVEGIFTHFSLAYYKNNQSTLSQYKNFMAVLNELENAGINIKLKHVCNSPAFINYPEMRLNAARIGSAFLGRVENKENLNLIKIGELRSQVAEIKTLPKNFNVGYLNTYKTKRQTKVAVAPIGYKDGFNVCRKEDMFTFMNYLRNIRQQLRNCIRKPNLYVSINGNKYNVIGVIGMYHLSIDITESSVKVRGLCKFRC